MELYTGAFEVVDTTHVVTNVLKVDARHISNRDRLSGYVHQSFHLGPSDIVVVRIVVTPLDRTYIRDDATTECKNRHMGEQVMRGHVTVSVGPCMIVSCGGILIRIDTPDQSWPSLPKHVAVDVIMTKSSQ